MIEKKNGRIKTRIVTNKNIQRLYINKDETVSSTISLETILLISVINILECRNIATINKIK